MYFSLVIRLGAVWVSLYVCLSGSLMIIHWCFCCTKSFFSRCYDLSGWIYVPKVSCYFLSSMSWFNIWCNYRKTLRAMKWVASKLNSLVFLIKVSDKSRSLSNNSTQRASVKHYRTSWAITWHDISLIKHCKGFCTFCWDDHLLLLLL